jgi:HSP20 family protein
MSSTLRAWNPWQELNRLRDEFEQVWPMRATTHNGRKRFPLLNGWEGKETFVITAELPGLDLENIDISVKSDSLTISGKREQAPLSEGESKLRQERWSETFERHVEFPFEVDPQKAEATYERGVLTVTLHRPAEQLPKKIAVKTV